MTRQSPMMGQIGQLTPEMVRQMMERAARAAEEARRAGIPGAQIIEAVARMPWPEKAQVFADSATLDPCLTRAKYRSQYGGVAGHFDRLGCLYNPETHLRYLDNCFYPSETRASCLQKFVPPPVPFPPTPGLVEFLSTAISIAVKVIPVLGPGLSEAIAPIIQAYLGGDSLLERVLGKELKSMLDAIGAWVRERYAAASADLQKVIVGGFETLATCGKALSDLFPRVELLTDEAKTSIYLTAGDGLREGFRFAERLLRNEVPAFQTLEDLALKSANVESWADVKRWQDFRKTLATLQEGVVAARVIGPVSAANLAVLYGAFPPFGQMTAQQLAGFSLRSLDRPIYEAVEGAAIKYSGNADRMLNAIVPEVIGEVVPDAARSFFESRLRVADRHMRALEPAVLEAAQVGSRAAIEVRAVLNQPKPSARQRWIENGVDVSERKNVEEEDWLRAKLESARREQDRIIKDAVDALARAPKVAVPVNPTLTASPWRVTYGPVSAPYEHS